MSLSRHPSLSSIVSGWSSGLHPVSAQSCSMLVRAGRPVFVRPCEGVHRNTSLMSSSFLLQQCPACLVRLTLIFFVMGGSWPYSRSCTANYGQHDRLIDFNMLLKSINRSCYSMIKFLITV